MSSKWPDRALWGPAGRARGPSCSPAPNRQFKMVFGQKLRGHSVTSPAPAVAGRLRALASQGGPRYLRGREPPCTLGALGEHGELVRGAASAGGRGVVCGPLLLLEQVGDIR